MMNCKACKNQIPDDSEFCPFCGSKIVHKTEEFSESGESLHQYQTEALLKRAFLFLEDGLFEKADVYVEEVLNREPENAEAYLVKLMLDLGVGSIEGLSELESPFDTNINYKRVLRYGDEKLREKVLQANTSAGAERKMDRIYAEVLNLISSDAEEDYRSAMALLEELDGYKDSAEIKERCEKRIDEFENDSAYELACSFMEDDPDEAIEIFEKMSFWRDSQEKIILCRKRMEEIKKEANREIGLAVFVAGAFFLLFCCILVAFRA